MPTGRLSFVKYHISSSHAAFVEAWFDQIAAVCFRIAVRNAESALGALSASTTVDLKGQRAAHHEAAIERTAAPIQESEEAISRTEIS